LASQRVATRFDKTARNYLAAVLLSGATLVESG
jgi:hypothetical protein